MPKSVIEKKNQPKRHKQKIHTPLMTYQGLILITLEVILPHFGEEHEKKNEESSQQIQESKINKLRSHSASREEKMMEDKNISSKERKKAVLPSENINKTQIHL